ncbi:acetylglutamate kinase [Candidatus Pantoea edessiphila]|uniref:acetylglutamate kinase n=1 Tax=Candidatus Pantoea edessiphila TaxID=2044610 RepID=UPI0024115C97|nr:acetylglutamate kinase [Candidatus Pantoea edessiphila]
MNPLVVKLGGSILEKEIALNNLFKTIVSYRKIANRCITIIHGGGSIIDNLMNKLSLKSIKKNGLRITPSDQIDIVIAALAGIANKKLLALAKKIGINAVSLCLGDGHIVNTIQFNKNLGHVGNAFIGKPKLLNILFDNDYVPIISSIGIDNKGILLNINADEAATALALTLNADLVLLSDVHGIINNEGNTIAEINTYEAEKLISENIIQNGMIIKVRAALTAARTLNRPVNIASWEQADQLINLFNGCYSVGTKVFV